MVFSCSHYISHNHITGEEKGLIRLLAACRTGALGSHYEKCNKCHYLRQAYNSCRNRHCPDCQQKDKEEWLSKRMKELLPVGYYHLVFTIPHQLNPICLQNKKLMYDLLFKAASQTLIELAKDTKHLGAKTGLITVLHTWGQNMMDHPHLHCIMPAGGLSFDKQHWVHIDKKKNFFVHYKVLSRKFRGKYLDLLKQSYPDLEFKGMLSSLNRKSKFLALTNKIYRLDWGVNIQRPLGNPQKVLEYLSRYVFRIAITNRRIKALKNGKVHFTWKDYRTGLYREMKLGLDEFIRRFLLHILPKGFFKVRYYGMFSSRYRKENIEIAKQHLDDEQVLAQREAIEDGIPFFEKQNTVWDEIMTLLKEHKKPNCPVCHEGHLRFAGIIPRE